MKNLNQLLSVQGYFTYENIPDTHKQNIFYKQIANEKQPEIIQQIKNLIPEIEIGYFYKCNQDTTNDVTSYWSEQSDGQIFLYANCTALTIRTYKGKYRLSLPYFTMRKFKGDKKISIAEPNQFTKPTLNILTKWFIYLKAIHEALIANDNEIENKLKESNEIVDKFIVLSKSKSVYRYENRIQVKTKYFDVKFKIDPKSGYLSTQKEFTGSIDDIIKFENI